jgi:hypothetical protein
MNWIAQDQRLSSAQGYGTAAELAAFLFLLDII